MTNYKSFDLEKALAGEPLITRNGHKVIDFKLWSKMTEARFFFQIEGSDFLRMTNIGDNNRILEENEYDLFMAPKKTKYYVNIYKNPNGTLGASSPSTVDVKNPTAYITTLEFEVEE